MPTPISRIASGFVAAAAVAVPLLTGAQQQAPNTRGGWPCGTRLVQTPETERSYESRFTPGAEGFRVMVEGKDADGVPFQRVHAPLFTPAR